MTNLQNRFEKNPRATLPIMITITSTRDIVETWILSQIPKKPEKFKKSHKKLVFGCLYGILQVFIVFQQIKLAKDNCRFIFRLTWCPVSDCVIFPDERSQTRAAWSFEDPRICLPFFEKLTLVIAAFAPRLSILSCFGGFIYL